MLRQQRLQHQLEIQSRQIERVFTSHDLPARVAGGTVQPRSISFDLQAQLATGLERLRALTQDLKSALGVPDIHLSRNGSQLRLLMTRPNEPPVSLLDLLPMLSDLPPLTAVLGLAEDGRPVLLTFSDEDVTHVLLSGGPKAGKTTLLRTLAVSLALTNRQSQLQLLIIDPETNENAPAYTDLEPLNYLPHLLTGVIYNVDEAAEVLEFLVHEMVYRQQQEVASPTIVVLIDKIASLLAAGGQIMVDLIAQLAQRGAAAGLHLILSARRPHAASLDSLLKADLPVRIVGQTQNEQETWAAAGSVATQAEYLLGRGDFLAVTGNVTTHFQAAYIGDYDLHLSLEEMNRRRPQAILAQPFSIRPTLRPGTEQSQKETATEPRLFAFDEDGVSLATAGGDENVGELQLFDDETQWMEPGSYVEVEE